MNDGNHLRTSNDGFLANLCEMALRHRVVVIVISTVLLASGVWAFQAIHVDAVPDVSNVQVVVTTSARGLAPVEVEQYVTYPVELALQSLPRLVLQRSISKYALSQVTAVFEDGTDIYWARQQVSERLQKAKENIPKDFSIDMTLGPIATGLGEIYQFQIAGAGYSQMQLRDILDWEVNPKLKTVPGVDEVQSMGGEVKEYQVWLHPEKMHGYTVSVSDVMSALQRNNANAGGGYFVEGGDQILIRGEAMLRTTDDIANVVLRRTSQGGIVRIRDVSDVVLGHKLIQSSATRDAQGSAVIGIALMRKGESSKDLVLKIRQKIDEIGKSLPKGVTLSPYYDRSWLIDRTIDTVWHNLLIGAILVLFVLFLILGDVRSGFVAALAIPLSFAGALWFLKLSDTSANLLSLGALDFGILIDGSVVMLENILYRLSSQSRKSDKLATVVDAACEVAHPIFFAVLIIAVVYIPILFLPGVSGKTFQPMALTVVFALLTALAVALIVMPAYTFYVVGTNGHQRDSLFMSCLRKPYRKLLIAAVVHPVVVSLLAVLTFLSGLACLPLLGTEFIPELKEGSVVLTINRPISASLGSADEQTTIVERLLKEIPEVQTVLSRTGHSEIAFDPMGPDETDTFVTLKERSLWREHKTQQDIEGEIAQKLNVSIPGICFSISQPIEQRMNELVAGTKADVAVRIFGPDMTKLKEVGEAVAGQLKRVSGLCDLKLEQTMGLPLVSAKLKTISLAAYGVSAQDVLDCISAAKDGKVVGTIFEGKPRYDLSVRFEDSAVRRDEDLSSLPVTMSGGELVPLGQVAEISRTEGAAQISHRNGERFFTVQANVRNRDLGGFVSEAQEVVKSSVELPPGYRIEWGGQFESMSEAQNRLFLLVPIALALIFSMLYIMFDAAKPGLLVFLNVPMALSGGLLALVCRDMNLSVTAGVGFIALFGIAVMNGVVLVSTIRQMEMSGVAPRQASILAARKRLRPVLMTALVASFGFLPMAFANSVGAEVQRPLATVVIGGLVTCTLLTLCVLPSVYAWMSRRAIKRTGKKLSKNVVV